MSKNSTLHIGIDVSQKKCDVWFMGDSGEQLEKVRSYPNTLPGTKSLESYIVSLMNSHSFDRLKIGTESTGFYDEPLVHYLASSSHLSTYGHEVFRLNARLVKAFKKAYSDRDKKDPDDAFVIADRLRFGRLPQAYEAHQPYLPLRRLTRYRYHLVQSITREKNCFLSYLFLKFCGFNQMRPAGQIFSATSRALVEDFLSPDEIVKMPIDKLVQFVQKKGRNRFPDPEEVAEAVRKAARESYRLRPALAKSVNIVLSSILATIRALEKTLKEIDRAIAQEFACFPNTLSSIPGIGPVYSAGIYAEIGDVHRFPSNNQIAKLAGLVWRRYQSGDFEADETRLIQGANMYLRYYLCEAANALRMHNADYKRFYETKYKEATKHHHKRAIVLTARKLVRLIYALLAKQQLYQPGFQASKR